VDVNSKVCNELLNNMAKELLKLNNHFDNISDAYIKDITGTLKINCGMQQGKI